MPNLFYYLSAARDIMNYLEILGERQTCLIGGLAVRLQGIIIPPSETPNQNPRTRRIPDIDIVILKTSKKDIAEIQRDLELNWPERFFLVPSVKPGATFKKLHYRVPLTSLSIKVDLLMSDAPELEISPHLHWNHFEVIDGLRVAPIYFLLYHKLLGWEKRISSEEKYHHIKIKLRDIPHIEGLCKLARQRGQLPLSKSHMGRLYLNNLRYRAADFTHHYQGTNRLFRQIGFPL